MLSAGNERVRGEPERERRSPWTGAVRTERAEGAGEPPPRIALYSHDTLGLGHMRRNLLLAQTLAASPLAPVTLALVGKPEACRFPLPPRGERIVLPGLRKRPDGAYEPAAAGIALGQLVELRGRLLRAALEAFRPDLLIVDNVPRGALRELDDALALLRAHTPARVVLGLRDVLDDPAAIRRQWSESNSYAALRDAYDEIWVYSDAAIFDAARDYWFPDDVLPKLVYTGYFDLRERLRHAPREELAWVKRLGLRERDTVLCLLGGGEDGGALAASFAGISLPPGWRALIVTGPYLPPAAAEQLARRQAADPDFRVLEFVREPMALVEECRCVVAMGGYNTTWEVVSAEKPLLVVPRTAPRREQWIRARRLAELGVLDLLAGEAPSAAVLSAWVAAQNCRPRARIRDFVPLAGLAAIVERTAALLGRAAGAGVR
jgi:predicted glycosyltransferase